MEDRCSSKAIGIPAHIPKLKKYNNRHKKYSKRSLEEFKDTLRCSVCVFGDTLGAEAGGAGQRRIWLCNSEKTLNLFSNLQKMSKDKGPWSDFQSKPNYSKITEYKQTKIELQAAQAWHGHAPLVTTALLASLCRLQKLFWHCSLPIPYPGAEKQQFQN